MTTNSHSGFFEAVLFRLAGARVAILFVFHALGFAACYSFAYLARFEFTIPAEWTDTFKYHMAVVIGIQLLVGAIFGFYRGWWRYVGVGDVIRLMFGLSCALAVLLALWYVGPTLGIESHFTHSPRGVLLIDWAFSLLSLFGTLPKMRLQRCFERHCRSELFCHLDLPLVTYPRGRQGLAGGFANVDSL